MEFIVDKRRDDQRKWLNVLEGARDGQYRGYVSDGDRTGDGYSPSGSDDEYCHQTACDFCPRGSVQPFTATGNFTDGSTQDVTATLSWSVKNRFIAEGQTQGTVRAALAGWNEGNTSTTFSATTQRNGYTEIAASDGHLSTTAKLTVVSPSRFAYITNNGAASSLSLYTVDVNSGDLRLRGYKPTRVVTESNPPLTSCVTTDPEYKYAYVSNPGSGASGNLRIYAINASNGVFTELPSSPISTSAPLNCIQFEPSGRFGYALGNWNGVNKLVGYSRDGTTGLLTEPSWSPMTVGNDPTGLAIDPLGQYLYFVTMEVSSGKPTAINGYSISAETGALTPVGGMPIFVSNTVTSIAIVHPSGNFSYISHGGGKTVDVYAIDRSTGLLKLVPNASMTTDVNPSALVFSADGSFAYMSAAISAQGDVKSGTITTFRVDEATGKVDPDRKHAGRDSPPGAHVG